MVRTSQDGAQDPTDGRSETRRTRGLSQRLNRPLSLESNAPEAAAPPAPPAADAPVPVDRETLKLNTAPRPQVAREGLLSEGVQLQDRYKILGVVGVGGMGAVYKAQDLRFPGVLRLCAVKEMINTASDPQMRQMVIRNFEREASILATLSHPAIPQVHDYFTAGSRSYLVLEFINGHDLEVRLAEAEGFFSEALVVSWAIQLCDVLSYLHSHKPRPIIFRDLKPSNIMLDDHERIRLVDFGIAKLFQSGEKGTMIGTEGYSPPEQYRGVAEPRGDVYALGATMHHLLSKQDPRLEPPFSFKERPIHKTNPTVSRELVEIIDKALEYDINARWGSAEELKRVLSSHLYGRGERSTGSFKTSSFSSSVLKPAWKFACEDEVRGSVRVAGGMVYVPCYDHNVYALDADEGKFAWKYPTEGGVVSTPWVSDGLVVFGSTDRVVYGVEAQSGRLAWTAPTKGRIYSSPRGDMGHVFIGSDDRSVYAIHQLSGRVAWTYGADGEVRSAPVPDSNAIYFTCQQGGVYALALNRELRWRFRARRGVIAAVTLHEGLALVGALDWNFYALDTRSGWAAWRYRTGGAIASTAAVWEDMVFFGSADGSIYALNLEDGRLVWRYQTDGQVTGSVAVHEGVLYVGGVDGNLYSLDARSGGLRWRYQTDGPITGTPCIEEGIVYFGSADRYVYAIAD